MIGETAPTRRRARPAPARKPASRGFRWTVRLLCLALSLMITRGLMQTPEVRALWDEGLATVQAFLAEERAQVEARAAADALDAMGEGAPDAPPVAMFADRVTVNRNTGSAAPRVLSGAVEDVLAGNAFLLEDVPVVLDGLTCGAPGSDAGRKAMRGLQQLTRAERLRCTVTGRAGDHAVRALCSLKGGGDLSSQMQAERLCTAS